MNAQLSLGGLHHLTAVTGNPSLNVWFYSHVLGLRLVKKTVNQDDVSAYHLFYGDQTGSAGTEVTFFDWPRIGRRVPGVGTISETMLRAPSYAALEWWADRLQSFNVAHDGITRRGERATLTFNDPEGQRLALVDDGGAPGGTPWEASPVPPEHGIRGLYAVSLAVRRLEPTAMLLSYGLGFQQSEAYSTTAAGASQAVVFSTGNGGPGAEVHVVEYPNAPEGRVAIGGVHHVAFRTPNDSEHRRWREHLAAVGVPVTEVIDRFYFRSIYFREPGGILFEIATDGPGFATDEDAAHLGERLALPPFLEPQRASIEAGLRPIIPAPPRV